MAKYNDGRDAPKPVGIGEEEILFEKITRMFSKEKMDALYKVMADTGISKKNIELWKVIVALELYKGYYETIPKDIKEIKTDFIYIFQEIKNNLLKTEANFRKLADQAETNSAALQMAQTQFEDKIATRIEDTGKAAESTAQKVFHTVKEAIDENYKVIDSVKAITNPIRWMLYRNFIVMFSIALMFGALAGFGISWSYHKNRADESIYLNEINRDALRKLRESGRKVTVVTLDDPKKKGQTQLYIDNVENAFKTPDKYGVIEFK
jgi:hypothetical protein